MTVAALIAIILAAAGTFVRLTRGPTVPDRLVAANAVGTMFFSIIVLLAHVFRTGSFLDVALVYAVLQFADVMLMAKYLNRGQQEGFW